MAAKPMLKRMIDAGVQFTEMSQNNAEKVVSEFVKAGQLRRKDAEQVVSHLVERGRTATEQVFGMIQAEVAKQLAKFANRLDDVEARVEDVAGKVGLGKQATPGSAKTAPVTKTAAKKAPARKKAAATKAVAASKAPAKKAATKKAATKKAAAK
jgi:polyhydroxyalkanoate synthesis regulator phasin